MPNYEVPMTASFFVEAANKEEAGNLLDYWWRLLHGVDVDKSYQMRQVGTVLPRRWSIGAEQPSDPAAHPARDKKVQDLMNKHRAKFKMDEASIRLIEEAEHEFEDV